MFTKKGFAALALATTSFTAPILTPNTALAYPVDCAIFLCMAGGFPPSAPCAHARAVMIQRITPWPVTPPLQLWRCPMKASYNDIGGSTQMIIEALFETNNPKQSFPIEPIKASYGFSFKAERPNIESYIHKVTGGADIDISGPAFDYVRSIRVWDIDYYGRTDDNVHGDTVCRSYGRGFNLGTYGVQGEFKWRRTNFPNTAMDQSWLKLKLSYSSQMRSCLVGHFRGVGIRWEDQDGNESFEVVKY